MDSDKLVILFGDSDQVTRLSVLITNKWEILWMEEILHQLIDGLSYYL